MQIKLVKVRLYWKRAGLSSNMPGVLLRRQTCEDTQTQRENHVKTEANTGVTCLHSKECQGLETMTRSQERGVEEILPQSPQKEPTLMTICLHTSNIQNIEKINLCGFSATSFVILGHSIPGKLNISPPLDAMTLDWLCCPANFSYLLGGLPLLFQAFHSWSFSRVSLKTSLLFTLSIPFTLSHLPQFSYHLYADVSQISISSLSSPLDPHVQLITWHLHLR